jgi:hypothetical protein
MDESRRIESHESCLIFVVVVVGHVVGTQTNYGQRQLNLTSNYLKLKENIARKKSACRKFICAFTEFHADSVRLRFDKMMLRFVYYPIMEALVYDEHE